MSDSTRSKYNLDYYVNLAEKLVKRGTHVLSIKDMAGLLKPKAVRMFVDSIRQRHPDVPIHLHTHDTEAGIEVVDVAGNTFTKPKR